MVESLGRFLPSGPVCVFVFWNLALVYSDTGEAEKQPSKRLLGGEILTPPPNCCQCELFVLPKNYKLHKYSEQNPFTYTFKPRWVRGVIQGSGGVRKPISGMKPRGSGEEQSSSMSYGWRGLPAFGRSRRYDPGSLPDMVVPPCRQVCEDINLAVWP